MINAMATLWQRNCLPPKVCMLLNTYYLLHVQFLIELAIPEGTVLPTGQGVQKCPPKPNVDFAQGRHRPTTLSIYWPAAQTTEEC